MDEKDILIDNQKKDILSLIEKVSSLENNIKGLEHEKAQILNEFESKDKKIQDLENINQEKEGLLEKLKISKNEEEEALKSKITEIEQIKKEAEAIFENFKRTKDEEMQEERKKLEELLKNKEIEVENKIKEQIREENKEIIEKIQKTKEEELQNVQNGHEKEMAERIGKITKEFEERIEKITKENDKTFQNYEEKLKNKETDIESIKLQNQEDFNKAQKNHEETLKLKENEMAKLKLENASILEKLKGELEVALKNYETIVEKHKISQEEAELFKKTQEEILRKTQEELETLRKNQEESLQNVLKTEEEFIKNSQKSNEETLQNLAQIQEEVKTIKKNHEDNLEILIKTEKELKTSRNNHEETLQNLTKTQENLQNLEKNHEEVLQNLAKTQEELKIFQQTHDETHEKFQSSLKNHEEKDGEIEKLRNLYESNKKEHEEKIKNIQELLEKEKKLNCQIENLENDLNLKVKECIVKETELDSLKKDFALKENEKINNFNLIKDELNLANDKAKEQEKENNYLKNELVSREKDLNDQINQLRDGSSIKEKELNEKINQIEKLTNKIEKISSERNLLENENKKLMNENKDQNFIEEIKNLKADLEKITENNNLLIIENKKQEEIISEEKSKNVEFEEELVKCKKQIRDIEENSQKEKNEIISSFEEKIIENKKIIDEFEKQNKEIHETSQKEINDKIILISGFDEKMQILKTQNSSLELEVKTLKQEIIEKNEKLQKLEENSQKIIQTPTPQANPNAKTITISLDELVKWDKKSKELNNQIKNLQIDNSNLKIELEEKVKLTNSIQVRQGLSLEGLEERCKALQNILDDSSSKQQHMESRIKMLEQENAVLKSDFDSRENEIRKFRESAKDKFEIERKLNEKVTECENYFNKFRRLDEERKIYEEKNTLIDCLTKEKAEIEKQFDEMKESYTGNQEKLKELVLNLNETKQSLHDIIHQKLKLQEDIENFNRENEMMKKEKDDLKLEIEDLESDKQIILKKSQNEIKDLKNTIMQEKAKYELLLEDRNKLERDIKNLLDKRISQSMFRKNSSETDLKSAKQEKIILESLALRVEDLENEKIGLVDRLKKCEGAIAQMLLEIENKKALIREIVTLTYETNPSLGETLTQIEKDEKEQVYLVKKMTVEGMQIMTETAKGFVDFGSGVK